MIFGERPPEEAGGAVLAHSPRLGAGGPLKETAARPLPRVKATGSGPTGSGPTASGATASGATASGATESGATESGDNAAAAKAPAVAAVVLAAGRSTRMGAGNKLLAEVEGRPMLARVVDAVLASRAAPVVLVTGHERDRVEEVLRDAAATDRLRLVHNPAYRSGLGGSLRRGLAALPEAAEGAVVCLGDMPGVGPAVIDRLIAAFDPLEGHAICLPTWNGQRGNPVLLARRFFAELRALSGDVGARDLIGGHPEAVREVPMDALPSGRAILQDVDTPEALAALNAAKSND